MAYYNTYSGLGAGFTNVMQAVANKARQIAQTVTQTAINAKNNQNPNPATATTTAAQAAQTATNAANYIIGSKTFENVPQLVQKAAAVPAAVPTTTPTVAPSNPPAQPKTWKYYLLWIALGGVAAFGAYKMLSGGSKKKRR